MTDRIHPRHDAEYRHADDLAPSAPPLHNTMAIQMPENAVRKEQEKGLMSQYEHAQRRQNDDLIYTAPPQAYQSYSTGGSYRLAPVGRRPRRRSPLCCCLLSFVGTLGTLILIAGIVALVVYLIVRPIRKPKYTIEGLEVKEFNVTDRGANVLNTEMALKVEASNPNKKIGIGYKNIEMKVLYEGEEIGEGSIPGFYQGHKTTTLLTIPIEGRNMTLTSATVSALQSDASVWMTAQVRTRARVKIGKWKSWWHTFHLQCSFQLSSSPHPGPLTLLSSSCKLRKPKFFFLGIHT